MMLWRRHVSVNLKRLLTTSVVRMHSASSAFDLDERTKATMEHFAEFDELTEGLAQEALANADAHLVDEVRTRLPVWNPAQLDDIFSYVHKPPLKQRIMERYASLMRWTQAHKRDQERIRNIEARAVEMLPGVLEALCGNEWPTHKTDSPQSATPANGHIQAHFQRFLSVRDRLCVTQTLSVDEIVSAKLVRSQFLVGIGPYLNRNPFTESISLVSRESPGVYEAPQLVSYQAAHAVRIHVRQRHSLSLGNHLLVDDAARPADAYHEIVMWSANIHDYPFKDYTQAVLPALFRFADINFHYYGRHSINPFYK